MMLTLCIVVGLCLVVCGIVIACKTKKDKHPTSNTPPPLPPRVNVSIPITSVSHTQQGTRAAGASKALPQRGSAPQLSATNGGGRGPRGIRPDQFPCCPFDKQRNIVGGPQLIVWDSGANCYRCSRGHQFKSNGKLL